MSMYHCDACVAVLNDRRLLAIGDLNGSSAVRTAEMLDLSIPSLRWEPNVEILTVYYYKQT